MWFVSRRGHEDEIAKLRRRVLATEARHDEVARAHNHLAKELAETEDKRLRLARWLADEKTANKRLTEEFAATRIVNDCLTGDLAAAREEIAELRAASSDSAATHWRAEAKREKKRADRLQGRLDDAVGLTDPRVEDGRNWQQNRQDGGRKLGAEA